MLMWAIIVILVILWLVGFLGGKVSSRLPRTGGWIHILIIIALILIGLNLLLLVL